MKLPPRGSAQDEILQIIHERERDKKYAEATLLVAALSGDRAVARAILDVYREYLFEDAYRPHVIRKHRDEARKAAQEKVDQTKLLEKVGSFAVDEPPQKVPRKKSVKPSKGK